MPREFDFDPNLTVEELIRFHREERIREMRLARQEEADENEEFAYKFEMEKLEGAYEEADREIRKRIYLMHILADMAEEHPEQLRPVDLAQYAPPERPAMDRIDLIEMLGEGLQEQIRGFRAKLQEFLDMKEGMVKKLDENVALIFRRQPELRPFIEGMHYTIVDIPADFNEFHLFF